ncbi:hypothetical protein VLK31_35955 [Variovorax sp. H27-G14]|uniref:hypothetical protein n=1 Tax=Variovorax sp. H27-G14 TaxID=3111914 RepID=UPI0038FD1777
MKKLFLIILFTAVAYFPASIIWTRISNAEAIEFRHQILKAAVQLKEGEQIEVKAKNTKKIFIQSAYIDEKNFRFGTQDNEVPFVRVGIDQQFAIHLVSEQDSYSHAVIEGNLIRLEFFAENRDDYAYRNSVVLRRDGRFVMLVY